MASITAVYYGATNHLGSRIKVTSQRGSKMYPFDYGLSGHEVFHKAVEQYLDWIKSDDQEKYGSDEGWGEIDDFVAGVDHRGEYVYTRKPKYI